MAVVLCGVGQGASPFDLDANAIWPFGIDLHHKSAGGIGSVFFVNDTHGAWAVVFDPFDLDELHDDDLVISGDGTVIGFISSQGKASIGVDTTACLGAGFQRLRFNGPNFDVGSIGKDDFSFDTVSFFASWTASAESQAQRDEAKSECGGGSAGHGCGGASWGIVVDR